MKLSLNPEKHIKSLILIPLLIALTAMLLVALTAVSRMHHAHVEHDLEQMRNAVQDMFRQQIESDARQMAATLEAILTDQRLQDDLARQDRAAMLQRTAPLFETLHRKYDITHFYFTGPDRVNLLRAHQPERFGDVINRYTTLEAERTGGTSWGIELGAMGQFTLRVVKPVFREGKLIGFIELGREIHHILPNIKAVLGVDIYATLDKQLVQRDAWEQGMRVLGRVAEWDRFSAVVLIDSTRSLDDEMQSILGRAGPDVSEHSFFEDQAVHYLPLRDASGKAVGSLVVRIDFAAMTKQADQMEQVMVALGFVVGLTLLGLFYLLLSHLQKTLLASRQALIEEAQHREVLQAQHLQETEASRHKLEEQAEFLETVIHTAGDGIVTIDSQCAVLTFNQAAERIFGYARDEVIGRNISMLIPQPEQREHDGYVAHYLETGKTHILGHGRDVLGLHRDGRHIPLYLAVNEVGQRGGERIFVGVIHDISDRERADLAMRERNQALERSNKELESFAYVASHDLQEPLRKVQAFGERLEKVASAQLGEQGLDYLARIRNAAARMQMLINDLLQFSRIATRAQPFEPLDLNDIAAEVISDLEVRLEEKQGRIELGELPKLEADPTQMRQLFQNLFGNSLKYSRADTPPLIRVTQTAFDPVQGKVTLAFADNGIGFEMKYAERIFGIFQRLHGKNEYEGSGVGLALCRKIVERHGGEIHAESVPGEGSTFFVTLPLKPVCDLPSVAASKTQ
ncbi:MAG: PAS domain S-box protein [Nitrosomonadales bacterium]|nr:PAS domain S-box protein [Nitrosomonadales bacterium]